MKTSRVPGRLRAVASEDVPPHPLLRPRRHHHDGTLHSPRSDRVPSRGDGAPHRARRHARRARGARPRRPLVGLHPAGRRSARLRGARAPRLRRRHLERPRPRQPQRHLPRRRAPRLPARRGPSPPATASPSATSPRSGRSPTPRPPRPWPVASLTTRRSPPSTACSPSPTPTRPPSASSRAAAARVDRRGGRRGPHRARRRGLRTSSTAPSCSTCPWPSPPPSTPPRRAHPLRGRPLAAGEPRRGPRRGVRRRAGGSRLLPPQAHHYTLLPLARARLRDQGVVGLRPAPARLGLRRRPLPLPLDGRRTTSNVEIYRIHRNFAAIGLADAATSVVERRRGGRQVRLGTPRLAIAVMG